MHGDTRARQGVRRFEESARGNARGNTNQRQDETGVSAIGNAGIVTRGRGRSRKQPQNECGWRNHAARKDHHEALSRQQRSRHAQRTRCSAGSSGCSCVHSCDSCKNHRPTSTESSAASHTTPNTLDRHSRTPCKCAHRVPRRGQIERCTGLLAAPLRKLVLCSNAKQKLPPLSVQGENEEQQRKMHAQTTGKG